MDFLVLFNFTFLSILLTLIIYLISLVVRGKKPYTTAENLQDTGLEADNNVKTQYTPGFFAYAICFLLFATQWVLLFPFAYIARVLDIFYIAEIMIFILILIFSIHFGIKSGLFELD